MAPQHLLAAQALGARGAHKVFAQHIEHRRSLVVTDDMAVTEHGEEWHWHTGEQVVLPFVSVMELRDGRILRWWDYWDMQTLMNAAPEWWVVHIMAGYK